MLCDNTAVQHDNLIGIFNGTHSMGNDKNSLSFNQMGDCFLNLSLIVYIKGSSGFVEQNDRRIL